VTEQSYGEVGYLGVAGRMGDGLFGFLKDHRTAWLLERSFPASTPNSIVAFRTHRCGSPLWGLHCRQKTHPMRISELPRPSPERLLKQVQAEESKRWGARLKIFLGYAPGVGKSYRMLDEARRRRERGEDVVVGAMQQQQSEELQTLLRKLELIAPLQTCSGQAMNLDAILGRAPQVCVVFPSPPKTLLEAGTHTDGVDVQELMRNGVSVRTSVNLLHVEEYRLSATYGSADLA
jgi:hypothetical protein